MLKTIPLIVTESGLDNFLRQLKYLPHLPTRSSELVLPDAPIVLNRNR